jgi:hypothetical protein
MKSNAQLMSANDWYNAGSSGSSSCNSNVMFGAAAMYWSSKPSHRPCPTPLTVQLLTPAATTAHYGDLFAKHTNRVLLKS